uniref:Adhesion G protein-coupled receptor F3b n=1 Tax=Sander lucioperca TaxID=283035 RepID=A0A8C9ZA31_SANLU
MLNKTWDGANKSVVQTISSTYLQSVEGLVKNIHVNTSNGMKSSNLDLKFCSGSDCNISVFDISVNLNKTNGLMKTVAVKNLMDKLKHNSNMDSTSLLISATLVNNNDTSLEIRLQFPQKPLNPNTKPVCVFWNTTDGEWSTVGCTAKTSDGNLTVCECNHLTSFSVLMAKSDISDPILDMITNVGLGVSICSLLIFLIVESLVWSAVVKTNLSHYRHTAIVNIAIFLLLGDCSFLASTSPQTLSETWCLVLTVCKHLFFLAMFSWMLCMSVMLVHQLIFVFSPLRKRVFMFFSSITGYVCPVLIVGSSYVYCKYTNKLYYNKDTCWLVYKGLLQGSVYAFILPIGTVILTNLFSMVVVILTLLKSSAPEGSKTDDKETVKSILKVVVFLTPVFGVTWVIGFGLLLLENNPTMFNIKAGIMSQLFCCHYLEFLMGAAETTHYSFKNIIMKIKPVALHFFSCRAFSF